MVQYEECGSRGEIKKYIFLAYTMQDDPEFNEFWQKSTIQL
ncbi:MAG: hypothetical protein WBA93_27520 [Microcoleaceae cyanobacterium]